jgi:hypothetical protein
MADWQQIETRPTAPVAQALLGWMQLNGARLHQILAEEAETAEDLSPAGDAAVLAHLRFVAELLAANAVGQTSVPLQLFSAELPDRLPDTVEGETERVSDAMALEVDIQFGSTAGEDPGLQPHLDRTVRIESWTRAFLRLLDEYLPADRAVADDAIAWMRDNQVKLANVIFAMDRTAKKAEVARGGPDAIASAEAVNRIGQAVVLQARTRFLVEALATTLATRSR